LHRLLINFRFINLVFYSLFFLELNVNNNTPIKITGKEIIINKSTRLYELKNIVNAIPTKIQKIPVSSGFFQENISPSERIVTGINSMNVSLVDKLSSENEAKNKI
jgi:hypothetical protein